MRKNPHKAWYLGPNYLKNNSDGYLINPDTKDIYWYHGLNYSNDFPIDIGSEKFSQTLYLSSSFETAEEFSGMGEDVSDNRTCVVYTVAIKIPAENIFDVRKAIGNPKFKEFAYKMFGQDLYEDLDNYFDVASAMHYELYDFIFNDARKGTLLGNGFVGWLETEGNVNYISKLEEPLTVALIQEFAADFCIVEDVDIVKA
jgi:hypothetical protein